MKLAYKSLPREEQADRDPSKGVILIIRDPKTAATTCATPVDEPGEAVTLDIGDLSADTLDCICPAMVVSPLVSYSFDCTDVAQRLAESEFSGELRIVANRLPRPDMVLAELRGTYPALDIDLLVSSDA